MGYPKLPDAWTPEIISSLSLREFGLLCSQYGFLAVWKRMDDDFYPYWEKTAPGTTFGEFLRQAQVPVKGN
jgi:hypothetical protein